MVTPPTLSTERLTLRPFVLKDADTVQRLAGEADVAEMTVNIPHPYEVGVAEAWISGLPGAYAAGTSITWAIHLRADDVLIGAISLMLAPRFDHAELGYWIGKPYWGRGYCTEAAREVVRHGFETLALHRIHAHHFHRNPASGRVMQKLGMTHEGLLRDHWKRGDAYEDVDVYGLLRSDTDCASDN